MAMLQLGMGETGVTTTPDKTDQFMDGAKVWLSPSTIGAEFTALTTAAKADLMGTLTSPRALGFLLVPAAAVLLLVWGVGAAKRRRRNPGRRRAAVRRRRANPRRRVARGRRHNPRDARHTTRTYYLITAVDKNGSTVGSDSLMTYFPFEADERAQALANRAAMSGHQGVKVKVYPRGGTRASKTIRPNPKRRRNAGPNAGRRRTARRRAGGGVGYYTKPGSKAAARSVRRWKSSKAGKRSKSRGTHVARRKNGRSWVSWGHSVPRGYTPGPGKKFQLGGRFGIVKSVYVDADGTQWVQFRRTVDGTTGMSLGNFRQAAYIE